MHNDDTDIRELMHEYEIDEHTAEKMQELIDLGLDDDEALEAVAGRRGWIVSDGKAGNDVQTRGVFDALQLSYEVKPVDPKGACRTNIIIFVTDGDETCDTGKAGNATLDLKDKQGRTPMTFAEGVFLAVQPPVRKPSTIALLQQLMGKP